MRTIENEVVAAASMPETGEVHAAAGNYAPVRFNALKHGILSRYTVLSHEDADEFQGLLTALIDEHQPTGATEMHLVEELAGVIWRKRRVLQAEGASINRQLRGVVTGNAASVVASALPLCQKMDATSDDIRRAMLFGPERAAEYQTEIRRELHEFGKARSILKNGRADAYAEACKVLREDARSAWNDHLSSGLASADAESLLQFLDAVIGPIWREAAKKADHHPEIKAQALGDGFQPERLESLARYETHLDRKFERMLAMLLKLKEIRGNSG